jgi:RimJ/RimL family protein N-acetyltransferase
MPVVERESFPVVETDRLTLRPFTVADSDSFAEINADERVASWLLGPLSRQESDGLIEHIEAGWREHGFGLWAIEVRGHGRAVGFTGLSVPSVVLPFSPCIEVGWRLAYDAWGHGYATEAARAALDFGFREHGLGEIVSLTAAVNLRSRAVMERIGMTRDVAADFDHPKVPEGHELRPHVLYRMQRSSGHAAQ